MKIKSGDIVARKSYGKDIIFKVDRVIESIAILKGITVRIEADSPLEDLEYIEKKNINNNILEIDRQIEDYKQHRSAINKNPQVYIGKILHLDGDKRYSEKSLNYYRKLGLNAIVKNISENRQSQIVVPLLERYNPDILVVTRT